MSFSSWCSEFLSLGFRVSQFEDHFFPVWSSEFLNFEFVVWALEVVVAGWTGYEPETSGAGSLGLGVRFRVKGARFGVECSGCSGGASPEIKLGLICPSAPVALQAPLKPKP